MDVPIATIHANQQRYSMSKKNQSTRLSSQQKETGGVEWIFDKQAKMHDVAVHEVSKIVLDILSRKYPNLQFRYRESVSKKEINAYLNSIDPNLGLTLFVDNAEIKPDGGIIEVLDDSGKWRIVLVSEAKHQGKDIENIRNGILVGKNNDQDLMVAGNAIERAHKNISEIANFMLGENHFPYILFLKGSNFLTMDVRIERPDGRVVILKYDAGSLNRLDRLTAANYGMPINTNLCKNKFIPHEDKMIMLQATTIYTQPTGDDWEEEEMTKIMVDVAETSLQILATDLFKQLMKR